MYTLQACSVPNGTMYDPYGVLARSAAERAKTDAATSVAAGAYNGLLCRLPRDFAPFGLNVAKDVSDVNISTGCTPGGTPSSAGASGASGSSLASSGAPAGPGGNAASGGVSSRGAIRGGSWRGRFSPGCNISDGGVNNVPLQGPGSGGLPQTSAQPAKLTTSQGLPVGMGRYRGGKRGLGQCCTDLVEWGDAFPNGGPSVSFGQDVLNWIQANPWLTAGIVAGGAFLAMSGGKRG
jgi:hypothetical protein